MQNCRRLHTIVGSIGGKNGTNWRWDSDGQRQVDLNESGRRQMRKDNGWLVDTEVW